MPRTNAILVCDDSVVASVVNTLGIFSAILYYIVVLRKYVNFRARQSHGWVATILTFVRFGLMLVIAFQWCGTKLGVKFSQLQGYPNFLILNDLLHMFTWLIVAVVAYMEWNRSLRPHLVFRLFILASAAVFMVKLHSIINQYHLSPSSIAYFNNIPVNTVLASVYGVLTLIITIGNVPVLDKYLELDESKAEIDPKIELPLEQRPATIREFMRLISAPGSRTALAYIIVGIVTAVIKGFLMQYANALDGQLFQAARDTNSSELLIIIVKTLLLYGAYSVGGGVVMFCCTLGSEKIVNGTNGIRNRMFAKLLSQEIAYHDSTTTGAIASQFSNDAERVKQILSEAIPMFIENLSLVFSGLFFLFSTAVESHVPWLPVYMLGLVPLTFGASYYQAERLEAYEEEAQARNAASSAKVQDVFSKHHTVMVYGKRVWEATAYAKVVKLIYNVLRPRNVFNGVITTVTGFLSVATQILAFFLGVEIFRLVQFGAFITFCLYAMNIVMGLIEVIKLVPLIGQTIGGSNAVVRLLERKTKAPEANSDLLLDLKVTDGAIEFKNVVFTYPTIEDRTNPTINNISFTVAPRTKVALIGDSGAGKTTIIQLIARFYDTDHGQILIDGKDIKNYSTKSIRKNMALVGQSTGLFATTILENIVYGGGDADDTDNVQEMYDILSTLQSGDVIKKPEHRQTVDRVLQASEQAAALDFVQGKLDLQLGEGGSGLSGGQRQRVTIARALYKNPHILLLDEVTSALDQVSEAVVQKAIDQLTANRTVLIVAHRLHTIQNADKIIVLEKGRIVAEGQHRELLETSEKYRKMVAAAQQKEAVKYQNTLTSRAIDLLRDLSKDIEYEEDLKALRGKVNDIIGTADAQVAQTEEATATIRETLRQTITHATIQRDQPTATMDYYDDEESDEEDEDIDPALLPPRRKD